MQTKRLGLLVCAVLLTGACGGAEEEAPAAEATPMPAAPTQGAEAAPASEPAAPAETKPEPATPAAQPAAPAMPEPTGGVVVKHTVKDYDAWKPVFDGHEQARRDAGFLGDGVMREVGNPKSVMVWLPTTDLEKAKAFTESKDLKKKMKEAGVVGLPHITLLTLVENQPTRDPAAKFGAFVEHRVKDYDAWKPVFDDHAGKRAEASVVGHAVGQDPGNSHMVYVWLQATDLDKLKAFLDSKDLKDAMKSAGVRGKPTITVVELGGMKGYQ